MAKETTAEIDIPGGIQADVNGFEIRIKGPKGEISRELLSKAVKIRKEDRKITIHSIGRSAKREKMITGTFKAHIKNMIKGASEGIRYKLKVCASHFPMSVNMKGDEFSVKNFLGEKIPRIVRISEGVNVKVNGEEIMLEGADIEKVGGAAAKIEQLTRITDKDRRIFQDGIYMIEKNGKEI